MLLGSTTLARPDGSGWVIAQVGSGYLSELASQIEKCIFQLQNIENLTKHSRNLYLASCLQLLGEIPDTARFIKIVLLATRLPKLLKMGPLVLIFRYVFDEHRI